MRPALLALLLALLPTLLLAADAPAGAAPLFDDNGAQLTIAQFVEKYIPEDMPEGLGRKEVQASLEDAGANWAHLAHAVRWASKFNKSKSGNPVYNPEMLAAMSWLLVNAPHLDRIEMTSNSLIETAGWSLEHSDEFDTRSDLFRRYVLNYRFDDESCSDWRLGFGVIFRDKTPENQSIMDAYPEARSARGEAEDEDYLKSIGWTFDQEWHEPIFATTVDRIVFESTYGFRVIDRGYFGNLSDPISLLHSRAGTKRELSILVAAALRSQGYATRFVRENRSGESWVEVYSGDPKHYDAQAWTPVYPTAPDKTGDVSYAAELCGGRICVITAGDAFGREQVTGRYTQTSAYTPTFWGDEGEDLDFSSYAITAWNDASGSFVPLDDLEYPASDKDYPLDETQAAPQEKQFELGLGEYRIEYGVRYPGGISHVRTKAFTLGGDFTNIKVLYLVAAPDDLPQAALVERDLGDFTDSPRLMHQGRYVFLIGDGGEPSLRELDLLKDLETRNSVYYQHWRMVGASDEDRAFVKDVLKVDEAKDKLPVVIVVVDGKTTMWLQGYNLNVAQWVERALEVNSGK